MNNTYILLSIVLSGLSTFLYLLIPLLLLFKIFYWIYWWQVKEYRTDRMKDFLSTRSGKKIIFSFINISEIILLLFLVIFRQTSLGQLIILIVSFLIFIELLKFIKWRIFPVWTKKAVILSLFNFCAAMIVYSLSFYLSSVFVAILIVIFVPLVVSIVVFILQPISNHQKKKIIARAQKKINKLEPIVIGITGSYGKTSTKEFLKTILEQKFSVLATPKNVNSDIGVAKVILNNLKSEHEIFIVEMGAYKIGEIKIICDLVSPIVGVVTAINEQHLSLFGSLENTKKAKAELIQSLPAAGLAVINGDNQESVEIAKNISATKKFFSVQDIAHSYATNIQVFPKRVNFKLNIGNESADVQGALYGKQVIPAILAAAQVANHLGLSLQEIAQGISEITTIDKIMTLKDGRNFSQVIDDSYNSNPAGFLAALDYLNIFKDKRKIVITAGMQELGEKLIEKHQKVGLELKKTADLLIITKKDFVKAFNVYEESDGIKKIIIEEKPKKLIRKILNNISDKDVVLIEGRVNKAIVDCLIKK